MNHYISVATSHIGIYLINDRGVNLSAWHPLTKGFLWVRTKLKTTRVRVPYYAGGVPIFEDDTAECNAVSCARFNGTLIYSMGEKLLAAAGHGVYRPG